MGDKIFLSYRRDDASGDARSVYQRLRQTFGKNQLFIDVDTIQLGRDFRDVLDLNLSSCRVLLAVIGPRWLGATDETGRRRLDNPKDFVRTEIARALAKNLVVIPVLVGNAALPTEDQLPDDIKPLVYRQAAEIRHEGFQHDMIALEDELKRHIGRRRNTTPVIALTVSVLAAVCAGTWFLMPSASFLKAWSLDNIGALWRASTPADNDIASVVTRCVKSPPHPDKKQITENLANRLAKEDSEYSWEYKGAPMARKITGVVAQDGELILDYDWRNGRLRLVPVIQQAYASRGFEDQGADAVLQGAWSQNNGYGCVELIFDDNDNATGKWGVAVSDGYDAVAFIKRRTHIDKGDELIGGHVLAFPGTRQ